MTNISASASEFGAKRLPDGAGRFRLWGPAQETVWVAIDGGNLLPMERTSDGWFEAVADVPDGTRYQYRLSDGLMVPDPASTGQAYDVHDASVVQTAPFV